MTITNTIDGVQYRLVPRVSASKPCLQCAHYDGRKCCVSPYWVSFRRDIDEKVCKKLCGIWEVVK